MLIIFWVALIPKKATLSQVVRWTSEEGQETWVPLFKLEFKKKNNFFKCFFLQSKNLGISALLDCKNRKISFKILKFKIIFPLCLKSVILLGEFFCLMKQKA